MNNRNPLVRGLLPPVIRLRVLARHITDGKRRDATLCMIREAVATAYPRASYIHADLQSIRFTNLEKGLRYIYFTPKIAQMALLAFDQGKAVEPFSCLLVGGNVRRSGWKPNHPQSDRTGKVYQSTGKTRIVAPRHRQFGICMFKD